MTDTNSIRTRKDGSIDYDYYIERSRIIRSREAHEAVRTVMRRTPDPLRPFRFVIGKLRTLNRSRHAPGYFEASR